MGKPIRNRNFFAMIFLVDWFNYKSPFLGSTVDLIRTFYHGSLDQNQSMKTMVFIVMTDEFRIRSRYFIVRLFNRKQLMQMWPMTYLTHVRPSTNKASISLLCLPFTFILFRLFSLNCSHLPKDLPTHFATGENVFFMISMFETKNMLFF